METIHCNEDNIANEMFLRQAQSAQCLEKLLSHYK